MVFIKIEIFVYNAVIYINKLIMNYTMTNSQPNKQNRRDFIKYVGGAAVGLGIGGLGFINSNNSLSAEKEANSKLQNDINSLKIENDVLVIQWISSPNESKYEELPNVDYT